MLAGSHRCLGSNVSSSSLETAAAATAANLPAEPLLFLYPRWFCATSRSPPPLKRAFKCARAYRQWPTLGPLLRQRRGPSPLTPRFLSARCYCSSGVALPRRSLAESITTSSLKPPEDEGPADSRVSESSVPSSSAASIGSGSLQRPNNGSVAPPSNTSTTDQCRPISMIDGQQFYQLLQYLFANANEDLPLIPHPAPRTDEAVKARKRADQKQWECVFNNLLELSQETFEAAESDEETISLPETTIAQLLGDIGENRFYVTNMSGCMVHVLPRGNNSNGTHRKVVLSGSPVSRRMTSQTLQNMAAETKLRGEPENPRSVRLKFAWTSSKPTDSKSTDSKPMASKPRRADTVPPPLTWTARTFNQFIDDLVSIPMPHSNHRLLYRPGERHTHIVCNVLCRLFDDSLTAPLISTHAANLLIVYLDKHGNLPRLWPLYSRIEPFMTTRSFNTLLERVSYKGDLRLFNDIVNKMRKAAVKPNALTWVCFLTAARSGVARASILSTMRDLGMLDNDHYLQSAMPPILSHDYYRMVLSGVTAAEFIAFCDSKIGSRWFSTVAAREMAYMAVMFRDKAAIRSIMKHCEVTGVTPDSWTMNQILRLFIATRDFVGGIDYFLYAHERFSFEANHETLDFLFSLAWDCRALNTCRIIWWYACLNKGANWSMRARIKRSLQNNAICGEKVTGRAVYKRSVTWEATVGKLVVGIEPSVMAAVLQEDSFEAIRKFMEANKPDGDIEKHSLSVIDVLSVYMRPGELRRQQCKIADRVVRSDLDAALRWQPRRPFVDMLVEAANTDASDDPSNHCIFDVEVQ
ncbi:hypothetical protein KEM56_001986 [Ascosphaera pollenicola]|nr:hypothetical protein KEM56_001986 [Ascosphaera pollenicola]